MAYDFPTSPSVGQQYQGYSWDGEKWAVQASGGKVHRFVYIATAGQVTFSGADPFGNTLAYLLGALEVIVNGIVLAPSDYTATNGTSVVLATTCAVGDLVYIQAFSNFSVLDALQKTLNGSDIPVPATFRSNLGLGSYAIAALGQLPSSANNTGPATGMIGERLIATGSIASLTSGSPGRVAILPITAGVWDVYGYNTFGGPGATSSSDWNTAIGTTDASVSAGLLSIAHNRRPAGADISEYHSLSPTRIFLSATTNHYLNAQATFTVSTYACNGGITAVRVN